MTLNSVQSPNMSLNPGIKMLFQVCMRSTLGYLKAHCLRKINTTKKGNSSPFLMECPDSQQRWDFKDHRNTE